MSLPVRARRGVPSPYYSTPMPGDTRVDEIRGVMRTYSPDRNVKTWQAVMAPSGRTSRNEDQGSDPSGGGARLEQRFLVAEANEALPNAEVFTGEGTLSSYSTTGTFHARSGSVVVVGVLPGEGDIDLIYRLVPDEEFWYDETGYGDWVQFDTGGGGGGGTPTVENFWTDGSATSGVDGSHLCDGARTTFDLSFTPSPPESLELYRNPGRLIPGVDFTLSGNTITITGAPPAADESLSGKYWR